MDISGLELPISSEVFSDYILFFYRLSFTMLVLQKAVKMVWSLPEVMRVAYVFMAVMLLWMGIWSFGTAGVVASDMGDGERWWLLLVSWQVLLFIASVVRMCIITSIDSNYATICIAGSLCKLVLDWRSPL